MHLPWNQFKPQICLLGNLILRIWTGLCKLLWPCGWSDGTLSHISSVVLIILNTYTFCIFMLKVICLVMYGSPYLILRKKYICLSWVIFSRIVYIHKVTFTKSQSNCGRFGFTDLSMYSSIRWIGRIHIVWIVRLRNFDKFNYDATLNERINILLSILSLIKRNGYPCLLIWNCHLAVIDWIIINIQVQFHPFHFTSTDLQIC